MSDRGVAPATRIERAIASIWTDVLGLDSVETDQDFFELGGESLAAVQMLAAVEDLLLAQISFGDFLDEPTVAALAAAVQRGRMSAEAPAPPSAPVLEQPPDDGSAPCTFAQERLWFVDQLAGGTSAYNESVGARIRGALDVAALERSLREIVRRHDALRTSFAVQDGTPRQVIAAEVDLDLERIEVSGEGELRRVTEELASTRFDLTVAPLMRAALVQVGPDDHVLELVFHHNVTDGLSHVIVLRELGELYRANAAGGEMRLPAPALQYVDHARRQRDRLRGQALEDAVAPWRERLADIPSALELPTDHPRPRIPSYRGAVHRTQLEAATTEEIRAFSHAEGVTPFATMLAGFDVLLARYSGQETIVVGSATAGRDRPELENVVGLFANTVVLRTDLGDDPSFRELVGRVRHVVLDALAHQDAPFERLVAEFVPEPDLSRHPIFQVMLVFRPHAVLELDGAEPFYNSYSTARTDVTLWVEDAPGGYELVWEYSTDLFEAAAIERMSRHYLRLLRAGIAQPDQRIERLPLLSAGDRDQLLSEWNDTAAPYPRSCLHELLGDQAARTPDRVAVACADQELTFAELDARANRLANRLRRLGVGPDVLVGVALERSVEMLVGLLGILKAGGAYVPVDPAYPAERVSFMLESSGAPVVLTQERLVAGLPLEGRTVLCLDRDWPSIESESDLAPAVDLSPEHLAYVIYTSGSTGEPKGVQIPHRAIVNFLVTMADKPGLVTDDALVAVTTLSFDIAGLELWLPLLVGARTVIAAGETMSDPRALATLLEDSAATVMQATPTTWQMLLDSGWTAPGGLKALCGGEALPLALSDRLVETGVELWNMYGPTETTVWSTCARIDTRGEPLTIGRPIANTTIYLLDRHLEPVPVGVVGELWIGGDGLARGYRGRDDLTAERFLESPFREGERIYRTGDLARYRSNGQIEFLGRIDNQVKVRGFRIELGEIETALTRHPAVAEAVVVAREAELAAYVIPRGEPLPARELREHCERSLPAYMVPATITTLQSFPLTPNGKVDRRALPQPARERAAEEELVTPRTPLEQAVAKIWQDVLELEEVGRTDNFFRLGGYSLLAARVVARARESLGIELGVRALFEHPVLSEFAALLETQSGSDVRGTLESALPDTDLAPLSFQQEALLFFDALDPGSRIYNAPLAIGIAGPLDREALRTALSALVERHEGLRTVLVDDGKGLHQAVLEQVAIALPELEVSEGELAAALVEHGARPFDLSREPLLRPTLFRLGADQHVLLLQSHHIVLDAWAVQVLYRDLGELYEAARVGRTPELPELGMSYREFARWQRQRLSGETLAAELDFWRAHLAGAPPMLKLPTDRRRPEEQTFEGATYRFELPEATAVAVREACEEHGVTPYMLLMAVFSTLLYQLSGDGDIVLGGPMANRDHPKLENLLGFCANTVVVRVRLGGNPTFGELLGRVRDSVLSSMEHQEVPLELVVDAVRPERIRGVNPLFQVNFRVGVGSLPVLQLTGASTRFVPVDIGHARFDLALEMNVIEDRIEAQLNYNTALFEPATIERLAAEFERLLGEALGEPGTRLLGFETARLGEPEPAAVSPAASGIRGLRQRRAAER